MWRSDLGRLRQLRNPMAAVCGHSQSSRHKVTTAKPNPT
jgi:hypothetical protein